MSTRLLATSAGLILAVMAATAPVRAGGEPDVVVIVDTSITMKKDGMDPERASLLMTKLLADISPGRLAVIRLLDVRKDADLLPSKATGTRAPCDEDPSRMCDVVEMDGDWGKKAREEQLGVEERGRRGDPGFKKLLETHLVQVSGNSAFGLSFWAAKGVFDKHAAEGFDASSRTVIWLSDGKDESAVALARSLDALRADGVDIVTVIFGQGDPTIPEMNGLTVERVSTPAELMRTLAQAFRGIVGAPYQVDGLVAAQPEFEMREHIEEAWVVFYGDKTLGNVTVSAPSGEFVADYAQDSWPTAGTYRVAHFNDPQAGTWRVRAQGGGSGVAYAVVQRSSLALVLLEPAQATTGASGAVTWPEVSYNPVPLSDDLLVPMPCNGAMAFRVVAVGPEPRELPEGTDFSDLAGPLPFGPNGQGAYLLGKYEVTRLQAAALRAFAQDSGCPTALDPAQVGQDQTWRRTAGRQRWPEARIAWFEARGLANDYAAWLRVNAGAYSDCRGPGTCVPRLAGEPALIRLPTEPEWEYAARGGQAVDAETFRYPLPPLAEDFGRYAWTASNTGTDPWPIGTRLAGPLGLHDLFGNVSEIQHHTEPSARGDLFIARGGGYQSQPDQADSRYRDRFRVYDEQGRGRLSETGLRLLIGAPAPAGEGDAPPAPDATLAYLQVQTSVPASVRLNGTEIGRSEPEQALTLTDRLPGEHLLMVQADGYRTYSETLALQAGGWTQVWITLEPDAERQEEGLSRAQWQRIRDQLTSLGHDPGKPGLWERITGGVPEATRVALRAFQKRHGLEADGFAADRTRAALAKAIAARAAEAEAGRVAAEERKQREREAAARGAEEAEAARRQAEAVAEAKRQTEEAERRAEEEAKRLAEARVKRQADEAAYAAAARTNTIDAYREYLADCSADGCGHRSQAKKRLEELAKHENSPELSPAEIYRRVMRDRSAFESDSVTIKAPDIAENGAIVPVSVEASSSAAYRRILIFSESNDEPYGRLEKFTAEGRRCKIIRVRHRDNRGAKPWASAASSTSRTDCRA